MGLGEFANLQQGLAKESLEQVLNQRVLLLVMPNFIFDKTKISLPLRFKIMKKFNKTILVNKSFKKTCL